MDVLPPQTLFIEARNTVTLQPHNGRNQIASATPATSTGPPADIAICAGRPGEHLSWKQSQFPTVMIMSPFSFSSAKYCKSYRRLSFD
ncbi:hypothetical protein EVAR_24508_1 [Eumeta japonica]|uniref:Uncharacterized protein n=1 Tax=Eumeta variegata TaxID=151549 RepID=A0A4C1US78_EUMVA|nr:hypothetical protein EVAR_24508_1 [Eumeta japonica]